MGVRPATVSRSVDHLLGSQIEQFSWEFYFALGGLRELKFGPSQLDLLAGLPLVKFVNEVLELFGECFAFDELV